MPQAVAAGIIAAIEFGVPAALAIGTANVLIYAGAAYLFNRVANALIPKPKLPDLSQELTYAYSGTSEPKRIIYGEVRVSGMQTIPPVVTGNDGEYLHQVLTIAGHEVDSFSTVWLDKEQIANADITAVTGTDNDGKVNTGEFEDHVWVRRYRGTSTQTVDYILSQAEPTAFSSNFRGRGTAYVALRYKWNDKKFSGGVPNPQFLVRGRRVYDPRLDSTNGGSGSQRYTDPTTWTWSSNPALCLRDYLTSELGGGFPHTEIDDALVIAAANVCSAAVTTPSGSQNRYNCNGVMLANGGFNENIQTLLDAMRGKCVYMDGKWRIYAGAWVTPTETIEKTDWVGPLQVRASTSRDDRYNAVLAWYVSAQNEYQRTPAYPRTNASFEADDGDERIWIELDLPFCSNEYEAQRHAEFYLRASRNQRMLVGKLRPACTRLRLYDVVYVNFDDLGLQDASFRIMSYDLNPDGSIDVALLEESEAMWLDLTSGQYSAPSTITGLTLNATRPSVPQNFTVSEQINGSLLFQWDDPAVNPLRTRTQIIASAVNCANAAGGQLIWEGVADHVEILRPLGLAWYWARSRVDSFYSAYTPNTYGLGRRPFPNAQNPFFARWIPDEYFEFTTQTDSYPYWYTTANSVVIVGSGGVTGGKMSVMGNATIYSNRYPQLQSLFVTGQRANCYVRWRKVSSINAAVPNSTVAMEFGALAVTASDGPWLSLGAVDAISPTQIWVSSYNALPANQWQETEWTMRLVNAIKSQTQRDGVLFYIATNGSGGTIEFDAFTAQPTATT